MIFFILLRYGRSHSGISSLPVVPLLSPVVPLSPVPGLIGVTGSTGVVGVVVHIFNDEARKFYSLEHLWADGEEVDLSAILPHAEEK